MRSSVWETGQNTITLLGTVVPTHCFKVCVNREVFLADENDKVFLHWANKEGLVCVMMVILTKKRCFSIAVKSLSSAIGGLSNELDDLLNQNLMLLLDKWLVKCMWTCHNHMCTHHKCTCVILNI